MKANPDFHVFDKLEFIKPIHKEYFYNLCQIPAIKSMHHDTGRLGAKGLYAISEDVPADAIRPGDLVFFENTMGPDVKGITHVGIYIGNNMMIHAGDLIGFADLKSASWARKIYA